MREERKLQIFTDFRQKEGENHSIINQRQRNDVDDEKENQLQIFTDLHEKREKIAV